MYFGKIAHYFKSPTTRDWTRNRFFAPPATRNQDTSLLLQDHQLPQERHITCLELVKIDPARHTFADSVSAIPIRSTTSAGVVAFALMSEIQSADDATTRIVNGYHDHAGVRQLIWDPRLRVERIRIVGKQYCLFRNH